MKKINLVLIIIVVLVVLVGGYFAYFYKPVSYVAQNSNGSSAVTGAMTGTVVAQPLVSIKNFAFNPTPLNIKIGTTVTWTNNDSVPHQIKSTTFNSAILSNGQNFSFTFSTAGTYDYSCAIHPSMHGQIIVTQ